jgi:sn-glycerol 3-phosphate transport system substrate-binding protein
MTSRVALVVMTVSITAAVALLVSRVCRRRPAIRHTVLLSALICILLNPLIAILFRTSGTSTFAWSLLPPDANGRSQPSDSDWDLSTAEPWEQLSRNGARWNAVGSQVGSASSKEANAIPRSQPREAGKEGALAGSSGPQAAVADQRGLMRRGLTAVSIVWLLGTVMLLARVAYGSVRVWGIRRSGRPCSTDLSETVADEIRRCLDIARLPTILISERVVSPVALGLFRGAVILPVNLIARVPTHQLCDVLTHECAHVVRRDPLVLFLQVVAGSLFWPIPFVHRLNRQLSRVREDLCDNHVLVHRSPLDYAQTLLRIAELGDQSRRSFALVGMLHARGELESRIASVIDERRNTATRPGRLRATLCLLAFLFASAVTSGITIDARAGAAPGGSTPSDAAPAATAPAKAARPPAKSPAVEANPTSSAEAAKPRRIQIWWGVGGQLREAFKNQVDLFNQSQTRIVAAVRMLNGYEGVRGELQNAFQKGDLPDAAIVEVHQIASLAVQNQIEPLDRFIKDDRTFQPADLLAGVLTNLHYREKLYALPINRSTPVLYYNKDRFTAAGLDPNKPPETWQQVREMSQALTSKDGRQYGFLASDSPWMFESMVWSDGGELVAGRKATFAEAGARPLQLWADLVHRDKTARFGAPRDVTEFWNGKAAMMLESTAVLQMFTLNCPFKLGTALVPRTAGFKNAVPMGGGAAVIPAANSSEQKAAAWEFLTWLINTKQAAAWSRETGYLPVRESARTLLQTAGFYREHPEFEIAIKELKVARESPQLPQWGAAWKIIGHAMRSVVRDDAPAHFDLKVAEGDVDELLESTATSKP